MGRVYIEWKGLTVQSKRMRTTVNLKRNTAKWRLWRARHVEVGPAMTSSHGYLWGGRSC